MLMFLEIILTISAWKKGWRWKALIPVAIALGFAFFSGVIIASSGGTVVNQGAFVVVDIMLVITQTILTAKAPRRVTEKLHSAPSGIVPASPEQV